MVSEFNINGHFPQFDAVKIEQIEALLPLYIEWNEKINVVSRKDIENLNIHHVLHSLSIAKYISFKDNTEVMDLGTGGELPLIQERALGGNDDGLFN